MDVIVEYEYVAQEPDELNLKVGDIITNVTKVQEGWCEGILNGKKGFFPDNFVKEYKENKKPEKPKDLPQKRASGVTDIKNRLNSVINNPPPVFAVPQKKKKARALFAYVAQNDDELNLEVGQIVEILKQEEPGWYEGKLNGQTGVFPSNFVELIDSEADVQEPYDAPEIKGRKVIGVGFGPNLFNNEQILLKPTNRGPLSAGASTRPNNVLNNISSNVSSNVPTAMPPVLESRKQAASPPVTRDDKSVAVLKAKALFAYKAENPDELSLTPGDIIVVLDRNLEDAGWWKGDCNGNVGVFPDNFVQLLPPEEQKPKKVVENTSKPFPAVPTSKPKLKNEFKSSFKSPSQPCEAGEPIKSEPPSKVLPDKIAQKRPQAFIPHKEQPKDEKPIMKQAQPPAASRKEELHSLPVIPPTTSHLPLQPGKQAPAATTAAVAVTNEMFADLQRNVEHLKEQLDRMKKDHEKTLLDLMGEIDEEKKTRYNMQVEMDRLRKLISSSVINS
ncbi:hypothetical protein HELRODRAFT_96485 [Helobdella robusta]|uniref:SH3 domain-containing protein n=1 Tax=Helobdella robusta TaxID=6412 RepID=T1G9C4_HELRO|nr:hypothetical protein HELRODRAFT_96485 [Helobdella robusta]ESN90375.1 hypothetical protein HELRODRAFT_96485 [Helobdella robusta]